MANLKSLVAKLGDAAKAARDDVEGLRDQRLQLIEKAEAVRSAPITEPEIRARVDHVLDAAERDARSWIIFQPLASADTTSFDVDTAMRNQPLGVASLLLGHEAVAAKLVAEAVASKPGTPMSGAVREAELARLAGETEMLEIAEEKLIRDAEAAGVNIARRVDANPVHYLAEEI